jgi:hypothetical protein
MSDSTTGFSANALQGITSGIVGRYFGTSANSLTSLLNSATDYSFQPYPFINLNGAKRHAFIVRPSVGTAGAGVNVAGEVYVSYVNATTLSAGPVVDDTYTINTIYDGTWTITKGATYVNTSGTDIAFYATGAFNALDGSSRILKSGNTIASGSQVTGTSSPLVIRSGVTTSDLFSGAFKVGAATASIQGATTKTSIGTGNWNTASIWSPSGAPSCSDIVAIASGHIVTVSGTASAAGVNIATGGTLTSSTSSNLTVGCTNNNAAFVNNGTYTISAGTIKINGSVVHNPGSTFNQTGGNIAVDANNAGDVATSVGLGASAFKIDSPLAMNLSAGNITIVDPLVNIDVATTATTVTTFDMNTLVSASTGITASYATGSTILTTTSASLLGARPFIGQVVTGTGIAAGTTITAVILPGINATPYSITLSQPTTADLTISSTISFSAMANGSNVLLMANLDALSVGQIVTGTGIPNGTSISSMGYGGIILSNPVSGLTTSPITAAQTLTFSGASSGCASLILAATNSAIVTGMTLTGTGIPTGTTVTAIIPITTVAGIGSKLDISNSATSAISAPAVLTFYKANPASYAFVYNSPLHNVAGMNHTLKFGNGTSIDNATVITNGFLTSLSAGGGILSLGNLTIDAVNSDRFVSSINKLNVQNTFTVNSGSVLIKAKQSGTTDYGASYFGGNIINNGAIYTRGLSQPFALDNLSNGGEVPSTIAQTISGTGVFSDTYDIATLNATYGVGVYGNASVPSLIVNNTSTEGITIATPNFRVEGTLTMNNGIIHTSSANPLYHGVIGSSSTPQLTFGIAYGNTNYIDGPYEKVISATNTNTSYAFYPVGKSGVFSPISLAIAGGGNYRVEAYSSNSGSVSSNVANLSSKRWIVQRTGLTGTPATFNARVGSADITTNNLLVQASSDQGVYDTVLGASTYAAAVLPSSGVDQLNNITTAAPALWSAFTGYFSYATAPNCSGTPNPGNTIADLTSSRLAATQNSTSTGIINGSTAVTLSAANASIVVGLTVSGTGIQAGTTVTAITTTSLTLSLPATQSSTALTALSFYSVSSPTSLCGSQTATLSLQNATTGLGLVYQWQSSTDGITYADIVGATATSYNAAPIVNTYYKCNVSCGANTGTSTAVQLTVSATTITATTPVAICSSLAPASMTLGATAPSGIINWYETQTSTAILGTGATFATPTLSATTTYYAGVDNTSTNSFTRTFSGSTTRNDNYSGMVFNTISKIVLNTVKVYPKQTAVGDNSPITLALLDSAGNMIAGPTTFTPTSNITTTLPAQTVTLNYNVPVGNGYKLFVIGGLTTLNGIGRLTSNTLPITQGAISITNSVDSYNAVPTATASSTLCMFDWTWSETCSTARIPVIASVVSSPVVNTTAATCSTAGSSTISNYNSSITYTFNPAGPTVGAGGLITGAVAGTAYTVTATGCANSATFTNSALATTNNVFFFIGNLITTQGCQVTLTNSTDPSISYTINGTNIIGDYMFENIPYGTYNYVVTKNCFVPKTGSVTVNCQPNGDGVGVAVGALTAQTTNNVFFFIGNLITTQGCQVTLTNSTDPSISFTINGTNIIGDYMFENIPYGTYNYVVTKNCFVPKTGSVTVNCQPNGDGVGVAVGALTAITIDTTITRTVDTLTVTQAGMTYQWVNCDNGNAPISGQTSQSFTPTTSGNYAVIVTTTNCTRTSPCFSVATLENEDFTFTNLKYYPNPVTDQLWITAKDVISSIEVYNLIGQRVLYSEPNTSVTSIDFSNLPSAIYLIKLSANGITKDIKVIKK